VSADAREKGVFRETTRKGEPVYPPEKEGEEKKKISFPRRKKGKCVHKAVREGDKGVRYWRRGECLSLERKDPTASHPCLPLKKRGPACSLLATERERGEGKRHFHGKIHLRQKKKKEGGKYSILMGKGSGLSAHLQSNSNAAKGEGRSEEMPSSARQNLPASEKE